MEYILMENFPLKHFLMENFLMEHFLMEHFLMEHFLMEHFLMERFLMEHFLMEQFLMEYLLMEHFLIRQLFMVHYFIKFYFSGCYENGSCDFTVSQQIFLKTFPRCMYQTGNCIEKNKQTKTWWKVLIFYGWRHNKVINIIIKSRRKKITLYLVLLCIIYMFTFFEYFLVFMGLILYFMFVFRMRAIHRRLSPARPCLVCSPAHPSYQWTTVVHHTYTRLSGKSGIHPDLIFREKNVEKFRIDLRNFFENVRIMRKFVICS